MPTATAPSKLPSVSWLIESRPPGLTWARPAPPQHNQPPLDLIDHELIGPRRRPTIAAASGHHGQRLRWAARRDAGYLMPRCGVPSWRWRLSRHCLASDRSQLNRWMVEEVLAAISIRQRRSLCGSGEPPSPPHCARSTSSTLIRKWPRCQRT